MAKLSKKFTGLLFLAIAPSLHAGTITVNTLVDNQNGLGCSLRQAIELINDPLGVLNECELLPAAGPDDTINFSVTGTIQLATSGLQGPSGALLPIVHNSVVIDGAGGITIDAQIATNEHVQVFSVDAPKFELRGLEIVNGLAFDPDPDTSSDGGAVNAIGTIVKVSNCTFRNNSAENSGGAIAIDPSGTLEVTNSTFANNTALAGGAIASFGSLSVVNSTFSQNSATGTLLGDNGGGAIGIGADATVSNSTFVGNTSTTSGLGASIFLDTTNDVSLANNILVGTEAQCAKGTLVSPDVAGNIVDLGGNLSTEASCSFTHPSSGVVATLGDTLGVLASNGGPTQTIALLAGSPAIASGLEASCPNSVCPTTDQRGVARPSTGFSSGAFQFIPQLELTCPSTTSLQYGTTYSSPLLATGGYEPYVFSISTGSLPTGLTLASNGTISGLPVSAGVTSFTSRVTGSNPVPIVDTLTHVFVESACQIEVTKAPLTITASSETIHYGDPTPVITPGYSAFVNSENASNLATQPVCTTTADSLSPALSSQTSSCVGAVSTNYEFTYIPGVVIVNKAPLTITPQPAQMTYGSLPPTILPAYIGFVNNQDATVLTSQPVCTTTATSTSLGGSVQTSTCQGATADNYAIDESALGIVTINRAVTATRIVSHGPNPSKVAEPFEVVVEVKAIGTLPGVLPITGRVTVSAASGETCTAAGLIDGIGRCMLTIQSVQKKPPVGLSAVYLGDSNYAPSLSRNPDTRQTVEAAAGCDSMGAGQGLFGLWQELLALAAMVLLLRIKRYKKALD